MSIFWNRHNKDVFLTVFKNKGALPSISDNVHFLLSLDKIPLLKKPDMEFWYEAFFALIDGNHSKMLWILYINLKVWASECGTLYVVPIFYSAYVLLINELPLGSQKIYALKGNKS